MRIYALDIEDLMELARKYLTRWFTLEECQQFLHTSDCQHDP